MTVSRADIDAIDDALLDLMARRAALVAELWAGKAARGEPLHDASREAAVIERLRHRAEAMHLDADAVEATFRTLLGRVPRRPSA